jgi:Putative esterase
MNRRQLGIAVALISALPLATSARAEVPAGCTGSPSDSRVVAGSVAEVEFKVLLPSDYATSGRRYPVLYLLHGVEVRTAG